MMDCCDEWDDFVNYINSLDATVAEGYEYYANGYDSKKINYLNNLATQITIHPTSEMKEAIKNAGSGGVYKLYNFENPDEKIECYEENGNIKANTNLQGIFILTYTVNNKPLEFLSNEEQCTGQCQECSDTGGHTK